MKIIPVASQHATTQSITTSNKDTRARAMQAFMGSSGQTPGATQETAGVNPNAIAPEDMGAIKQPTDQLTQIAEQATAAIEAAPSDSLTTNETVAEAPATLAAEETKADPALSRQFAQLARQEKALRAKVQQQEQTFKAREESLKTKETQIAALEQQYKSGYISHDELKANTLSVLANVGVSYDELTQQILNQQPRDPRLNAELESLKSQIRDLKAANEQSAKAQEDQQKSSYQAAINQIRSDAKKLVSNDPAFETIRVTNSINDVVELIERTWQEDGTVLSVDEAAAQVEDYLVERLSKIVTNTGKIKQRLSQASAQAAKETPQQTQAPAAKQQTQPQPMKTLTNATSSTRKLTAKERAILAFKGQLKS